MRWSVIFASIYITEKEGDFGQFKGKFFIFVGCDSFSSNCVVIITLFITITSDVLIRYLISYLYFLYAIFKVHV